MKLALFETSAPVHHKTMPLTMYGVRKGKRPLFSTKDLTAILYSVLGLISSSAVLSVLLLVIFVSEEPFSISDSLKDIRLTMKKLRKEQFVSTLTVVEQEKLATQVKLVSEIIGRSNRAVDKKGLALSIVSESMRANIDPLFVTAVVKSESTFKTSAISSTGARGLMQVLPSTAKYTEQKIVAAKTNPGHAKNLHHSEYNLQIGIAYLKHLHDLFSGNRELALIAYNWGPGNLLNAMKSGSQIPAGTKDYAKTILKNHKLWKKQLASETQFAGLAVKKIA